MERYNHKQVEEKWQNKWDSEKIFQASEDYSKQKYYVLDVSLSFRKDPYGARPKLHDGGCRRQIQKSSRIQCSASNGMGRLRNACRECRYAK